MYLEVIFSAPDIQRQLPTEAKMFIVVDKKWKEIMRRTAKVPTAILKDRLRLVVFVDAASDGSSYLPGYARDLADE